MSSGGKSGGDTQATIRYAPYLEGAHSSLIDHKSDHAPMVSMIDLFNAALDQSPYSEAYSHLIIEPSFFGTGYTINSFPSLYDMFGKFMAGLDACDLWGEIYENVVHGPEIQAAIAAHSAMIQDEIDSTILPKFLAGMRDINAVQSSAFVTGKAIIADGHTKALHKFASEIELRAVDASAKLWVQHLEWNKDVVKVYAELAKFFYDERERVDRTYFEFAVKDKLWNLNLLDYARAVIGALNGAAAAKSEKEPSMLQKIMGGALGGMSAGGAFGGVGSLLGGALGIAGAFF